MSNSISSVYPINATTTTTTTTAQATPPMNFTIWSPQTEIVTGGPVALNGNLSLGKNGVSGQKVSFYLNGTLLGNAKTDNHGIINATFQIPFIYSSSAVIWAYAPRNSSANLRSATSNYVYFTIIFNQTEIELKDPPTYLPTFNFDVEGNLTTVSGVPLPNAPVKITFVNYSTFATTNGRGTFIATFTVPADAKNGIYDVDASFAPQGLYGPSFNFTTIQVTHLLLNVSVQSPKLSFAGFYTQVSGTRCRKQYRRCRRQYLDRFTVEHVHCDFRKRRSVHFKDLGSLLGVRFFKEFERVCESCSAVYSGCNCFSSTGTLQHTLHSNTRGRCWSCVLRGQESGLVPRLEI